MKKALLAALFATFAPSWCLAQTDSLPAPTAEPCQSAPCAEPCQPGDCAMPCQPASCAEPFVPKWAVGLRVYQIVDLPGTVYLERLYGKSSLEYYLSAYGYGDLTSDGDYLESKYDYAKFGAGVTYKRLMTSDKKLFKLYLGTGPRVYYGRNYRKYYNYSEEYYEDVVNNYGIDLSVFLQIRVTKDMVIKNIRLRNELNFTPANVAASLEYRKHYNSERDTTVETLEGGYDFTAISSGSVSYSIKYLF